MLKLFHRMFARLGLCLCAVLLLASGITVGQERRPPVLKGGVQKQDEYANLLLKSVEDNCEVARQALDLFHKAAANPELVASDEWKEVNRRLEEAVAVVGCHCPFVDTKVYIERLRRMQVARPNPRARAELLRPGMAMPWELRNGYGTQPTLQNFDFAIQKNKEKIRETLREAEKCFDDSCRKTVQILGGVDRKSKPRPEDEDQREDSENESPGVNCWSNTAQPPPPPPARPAPVVCNLKELAELVFERYNTGEPIRIVRVANRPNTYLMLLSGTEFNNRDQATALVEDFLETSSSSPSLYRLWVKYALSKARLPRGSKLIMAGHSLGGMVVQNILHDKELTTTMGLQPERAILFGSPNVARRVDGTRYIYVEHVGDLLLNRFNREHKILPIDSEHGRIRIGGDFKEVKVTGGGGTPDIFWGYHSLYDKNLDSANYDLQGNRLNSRSKLECLQLDLDHSFSFTAANQSNLQNRVSEEIGEIGMEREAKRLGYMGLVPPSKASNRPQGYDGIYWDPKTGEIVIGEAKGGGATLGQGYGYKQGTIEWARAAANAIVKSRTANSIEERYALLILCALDEEWVEMGKGLYRLSFCDRLQPCKPAVRIELFHTENINGRPGRTTHRELARYPQ